MDEPTGSPGERKKQREEVKKSLEELVETFSGDIEKALAIKNEKDKLADHIEKLKMEEVQLHELVDQLKTTRDTLMEEIKKKETEERELKNELQTTRDERSQLKAEKLSSDVKIRSLEKESNAFF